MSFVMQYLILRAVLVETHEAIQTPSAFALPYSELHVLKILWRFSITKPIVEMEQWKTCCILHNMGLVKLEHGSGWFVSVTSAGALFLHELKTQAVKAAWTVAVVIASGVLGVLFGVSL